MPYGWTAKFVVNEPVPTDVFEGRSQTSKYCVIERPEIQMPIPKGLSANTDLNPIRKSRSKLAKSARKQRQDWRGLRTRKQ